MFRSDAEPDKTSGNSPQKRNSVRQPERKRRFKRFALVQDPSDHSPLNEHLQPLGHPSRKLASFLNALEIIDRYPSLAERFRKHVGGGNGILDREVNAYSTYRRHCMGGITDA
jgi:hypothetical protein